MRIFILDDLRSIEEAIANSSSQVQLDGTETIMLARTYAFGLQTVRDNSAFDLWILDNDLGIEGGKTMEGHSFMRQCMEEFPDKVPTVISCSANPIQRTRIVNDYQTWVANDKQSWQPIGAE